MSFVQDMAASIYSSTSMNPMHVASHVLTDGCEKGYDNWLLPDQTNNAGFIIDTGKETSFKSFSMKNTHNWSNNDRWGLFVFFLLFTFPNGLF